MSTSPLPNLVGRNRECQLLEDVLTGLRAGRSTVCVIRGEAGIGKTVLLEHLTVQASGITVTRAQGIQADMEMAYASLHQVCAPFLSAVESLPEPQREALQTAFGLATGDPPDRFLVGLAVLTLLTRASDIRPVLLVVDDAQWLDTVSLQTLQFVARRLLAEAIAMVFAVREPEGATTLAGMAELRLEGLDHKPAAALLESAFEGRLEPRVRDRLVAETRGNPLALLELSRGHSAAELAYGLPETAPGSVPRQVEQDYARRLDALPEDTRTLLLIAAAEPVGDGRLLVRAAELLGITIDAAPAKAAGLIEFGEPVLFRHPLVRSAVYQSADPVERRAVHRALAAVTDPVLEPDRRAWHVAQAADGPDESAAAGLERAADRARQRGGVAAEAVLLERATALTVDGWQRGLRALGAAEAYFSAAEPDRAIELARLAGLCPLGPLDRARLKRLRARLRFALSRSGEAAPLLLDAADQLAAQGSPLARETYVEAISATVFAGRVHGPHGARAAAVAARASGAPPSSSQTCDLLLDGVAALLTDDRATGVQTLHRALDPIVNEELGSRDAVMRWLIQAQLAQEAFVHQLWDFGAWQAIAARAVQLSREQGALSMLPLALMFAAGADFHRGEVAKATGHIAEANAISAATGYAPLTYASLVVTAWQGDESATLRMLEDALQAASSHGEVSLLGVTGYVKAVLYNGLGRYDLALAGAREGVDHDGFNFTGWALTEHIEAAVRCGERDLAQESLGRLAGLTSGTGTGWAQGIQARSEALLRDGAEADRLYRDALLCLEADNIAVQVARTRLLYGEWLRRARRRSAARQHLREALEMFEAMDLTSFAERTRRELLATGEHLRTGDRASTSDLTPQEGQIAALASAGMTNARIGAELFLSPNTIDWHLRKVFAKLGIRSRRDLSQALATPDRADRASPPTSP